MKDWLPEGVRLSPSLFANVRANLDGVIFELTVDDVHATDLRLTPKQARAIAALLIQGADKSEDIQEADES